MLTELKPHIEFTSMFPIEFCRQHGVLAVVDGNTPVILNVESAKPHVLDVVGRALGQPLESRMVDDGELKSLTNAHYEHAVATNRMQSDETLSLEEFLGEPLPRERADDLLESDNRGATVKLVNDLLLEAVQVGASDVHLQPFEDYVIVRMRLDGVLEDIRKLPRSVQDEVISRLKVAGKMNIAERRLPQNKTKKDRRWS